MAIGSGWGERRLLDMEGGDFPVARGAGRDQNALQPRASSIDRPSA